MITQHPIFTLVVFACGCLCGAVAAAAGIWRAVIKIDEHDQEMANQE